MRGALRRWSLAFLLLVTAGACSIEPQFDLTESASTSWGDEAVAAAAVETVTAPSAPFMWPEVDNLTVPANDKAEVATLGEPLAPAPIGFDALAADGEAIGPVPIGLTIESIDIEEATVIPVGIDAEDASMEIPPAEEVGWYRFGASPGNDGSAVLAAHIAYDGRDGVFLRLAELSPGSIVVISFDDGSTQRWIIEDVTDYVKSELPAELFRPTGEPQLALITCGGLFNPGLRSYDSNTVAVARPLANP